MKKTDIECFPIYRMTASQLEEKRHTDGYIHMNINALETRWPCQKTLFRRSTITRQNI